MINYLIKKIFGTKNEREIKKLRELVLKINQLEPELDSLTNKQLIEESVKLKEKVQSNEHISTAITEGEIIPEVIQAFALVRKHQRELLG